MFTLISYLAPGAQVVTISVSGVSQVSVSFNTYRQSLKHFVLFKKNAPHALCPVQEAMDALGTGLLSSDCYKKGRK